MDHVPHLSPVYWLVDGPKELSTIEEESNMQPLGRKLCTEACICEELKKKGVKYLTLQVHSNAMVVSCLHTKSNGGNNYQHPNNYSKGEGSASLARE
jgi:hypothetical protein